MTRPPLWPRLVEHKKCHGNVRISELAILSSFAAQCPNRTNLFEIGTFDGRTALNLAWNSHDQCQVYTLDLPRTWSTQFSLHEADHALVDKTSSGSRYEKYRTTHPRVVSRISQLYGDSATFDYIPYENSCSLVFVDGSHAYDYVRADTRAAMRLVLSGGVILWHDYGIWDGVTRALEELNDQEQLGLRHIHGTSLVAWRKP